MKHPVILSLVLVFTPAVAAAQAAPPAAIASTPTLNAQQQAAMQQLRAQFEQSRLQTRVRLLAALTPAHRTAVANIVGQLALTSNPNPRAAAQALDAVLAPAEKQSILNIAAVERANRQTFMLQERAVFESTMTADQRAQMAQRQAKRQAYTRSHPHPAHVADPGALVLRTLGSFGGHGGMRGHMI